ncbi:hypothetical protein MKW94_026823, partial [Papaver nudicaule]|nr:hypothetical protein [Papaver nudicaule]
PPILVSDILWQKDEYRSPTKSHQILRRKDSLPASKTNTVSSKSSLEEREAAYSEARRRYFPEDSEIKESVTPKPRNIPVVARRMIGHALGLRVSPNSSGGVTSATHKEPGQKYQELSGRENSVGHRTLNLRNSQETAAVSIQELSSQDRKIVDNSQVRHAATSERESERKIQKKPAGSDKSVECVPSPNGRMGQATSTDTLKQEHVGAAKRMFAHAMRLNGTKELNGLVMKTNAAIPADRD